MRALRVALPIALLAAGLVARAEDRPPAGSRQPTQASKCNDVPAHPFDIILGRPEADSITASVVCYEDAEGFIAYGTAPGNLPSKSPSRAFKNGEPGEIVLPALKPDTRYFYELRLGGKHSPEATFQTARPPGSTFTFTITSDSHLDANTDPATYQKTLANALADKPDFHIDLGDTFMTEKHESREAAARQYLAQRYYLGQLCQSAPLFFVLGNHDGESPRGRGDGGLAAWSNLTRKRYFPNPVPDKFYSGDGFQHPEAGLLQDYYAWEWGGALFVVLDPYWFMQQRRGRGDCWKQSLGLEQYQWLRRTLESSRAKFKFVFIHHLVGGANDQARGGAEAAPLYEWGGKNPDGTDGFAQNRPGWPAPIHELLVNNNVSIVFHGHDHLYARQDLDGIVYQEVPQPGYPGDGKVPRSAEEYGYLTGTILGSSGHLRVKVSPDSTVVDYVRSSLDDAGPPPVAHSFAVKPLQ
ncbi:MAG: metallophosphoesterase [Verrucomicrobiae bacterium]